MSYWPDQRPQQPPTGGWSYPQEDVASERTARLTLTLLAASFAVLVVGLVVFFTVKTLRQNDEASPSPVVSGPAGTTPEQAAKVAGGIGPPAGADVVTYGKARKEALAAATGDRIAIVSFWNYTTETKAKALVADAEIMALMAAAPGGQPAVVTSPLSAWVTAQTAEARTERDEVNKLIATVQEPQFKADYRARVDELTKLINSIKPTGDLVFGLVVRAPATTLQALQTKAEIRIVDVGPTGEPEAKPIYRGLRPEENSKANEPSTRPA